MLETRYVLVIYYSTENWPDDRCKVTFSQTYIHIFVESNKTQYGRQGKQRQRIKTWQFCISNTKASNKRDQPESSPDHTSPSTQHLEKQARISAFGSPLISESVKSNTVSTDQAIVSLKVVSRKRRRKCTLKSYDRFTNN